MSPNYVQLEKMYSEAAAALCEILTLEEKVAITTYAWTALNMEAYVTVTFLLTGLCRVQSAQYQRGTLRKKHEFSLLVRAC